MESSICAGSRRAAVSRGGGPTVTRDWEDTPLPAPRNQACCQNSSILRTRPGFPVGLTPNSDIHILCPAYGSVQTGFRRRKVSEDRECRKGLFRNKSSKYSERDFFVRREATGETSQGA
jgi:hypothetical protein